MGKPPKKPQTEGPEKPEYLAANRRERVISTRFYKETRGSVTAMTNVADDFGITQDEWWVVWTTFQSGSLPPNMAVTVFENEAEAKAHSEKYKPGTVINETGGQDRAVRRDALKKLGHRYFHELAGNPYTFSAGGGDDGGLSWSVLTEAGISDGIEPSPKVHEFLGKERVAALLTKYGDNWSSAAELEYCWYNLPHTSSAYVAAQRRYNEYITYDDFSAGYLQRDLEVLAFGVEAAAARASEYAERQAKRAAEGGKAQAAKAALRKSEFFRIALKTLSHWVWRSESEQLRYLKQAVAAVEGDRAEPLFTYGTKPMSDSWFEATLSELRQSGELERAFGDNKP